jgi:hypothetical protein
VAIITLADLGFKILLMEDSKCFHCILDNFNHKSHIVFNSTDNGDTKFLYWSPDMWVSSEPLSPIINPWLVSTGLSSYNGEENPC